MHGQNLNFFLLVAAVALNGVTFLLFAIDKLAAIYGRQRISEKTLLLLSLAGGWPAGGAAQIIFRHKTKKLTFRWRFITVIIINCALIGWLVSAEYL